MTIEYATVRRLRAFLLALLCPLTAHSASLTKPDAPTYSAAACCTLCPRASDPKAYVTQFLRDHQVLLQGRDDWLFHSKVELEANFPIEPQVLSDLGRLTRALKARGVEMLLLETPPRGLMHYAELQPGDQARFDYDRALATFRRDLAELRSVGFIVPDYGLLIEQKDPNDFYYHRDVHWTPEGARRTANLIADTVKTLPLFAKLKPQAFTTRQAGTSRQAGVLSLAATQLCGGHYPWEVSPTFVTEAIDVDPFADVPPPEVVIVGTSFSGTPDYNFADFLQQSLQAVVQNVAISGGGPDGSLAQYLTSETFQKTPPKLLIWELSRLQIANLSPGVMRRLLSLIGNGCASQPVLLEAKVDIPTGAEFTDVLFNGGNRIITEKSEDLLVDLQFADATVGEFLTEIWYLDGKHEVLRVRLNDFTRTGGRFVLEMNHAPDFAKQPVIAVRLQMVSPLAKPTLVKAQLCRARAANSVSATR